MLDDKDDFGRDYEPGYCAMARGQVQYWFFEWTPYFAFERNKKPHLEVKDFIKYFGPCIDHELVLKGARGPSTGKSVRNMLDDKDVFERPMPTFREKAQTWVAVRSWVAPTFFLLIGVLGVTFGWWAYEHVGR